MTMFSDFVERDDGTWYVPGDRPATAAEARLLDENERLSSDVRRLRTENKWLRNRRNRAVELLSGDPGDDPLFIAEINLREHKRVVRPEGSAQ